MNEPVRYVRPLDTVFSVDMTHQEAVAILALLRQAGAEATPLGRRFEFIVEQENRKRDND